MSLDDSMLISFCRIDHMMWLASILVSMRMVMRLPLPGSAARSAALPEV